MIHFHTAQELREVTVVHVGRNGTSVSSLWSCASSMGRHNSSAIQQHHLQSAAWTSH